MYFKYKKGAIRLYMKDNKYPSPQELAKEAIFAEVKTKSNSMIHKYRDTILILITYNYNQKELIDYFLKQGISIEKAGLSRYLKKHPPTEDELNNTKKDIKYIKNNFNE